MLENSPMQSSLVSVKFSMNEQDFWAVVSRLDSYDLQVLLLPDLIISFSLDSSYH